MPAAYAHHTFGEACIAAMPEKLRTICNKYRELFDFGVHGPDILFYYKPLSSNPVAGHGSELHHWTGAQVFEIFKYVYQGMPRNSWSKQKEETEGQTENLQIQLTVAEKNAMLAYMLGFLAHFTLDSSCHGYINSMTEQSDLSHNKIESQYEAFLMNRDGKEPLQVDRSLPLKPTKDNAAVIARFFPFSEKEILESLKGQKSSLHLFFSPTEKKKKLLRTMVKTLKLNGDFGDLFLDEEMLAECQVYNEEILKLQKKALKLYPGLLQNFIRYLYDKSVIDEYFKYDFEGELH